MEDRLEKGKSMRRNETISLKGIAIILMFWHHLFGCGTFLTNGVSYVWVPAGGYLGTIFRAGCKICIAIFAVASGYGLYKSYIKNNSPTKILPRIINFLLTYWTVIFCVAVPYLIYFKKFHIEYIWVNLFALLHNDQMLYVSLSWYVKVYLEFLIALPLVKLCSNRIKTIFGDIVIFVILPTILMMMLPYAEENYVSVHIWILSSIRLLFRWFPVFYMGVIFAKYNLLEKILYIMNKKKVNPVSQAMLALVLMVLAIFLKGFNSRADIIVGSLFLIGYDICYKLILKKNTYLKDILLFLGKYSFQYWLLSGMFFLNTTEFTSIIYRPKITIIICIWNFIILTPGAILMQKISDWLCNKLTKFCSAINCTLQKKLDWTEKFE